MGARTVRSPPATSGPYTRPRSNAAAFSLQCAISPPSGSGSSVIPNGRETGSQGVLARCLGPAAKENRGGTPMCVRRRVVSLQKRGAPFS